MIRYGFSSQCPKRHHHITLNPDSNRTMLVTAYHVARCTTAWWWYEDRAVRRPARPHCIALNELDRSRLYARDVELCVFIMVANTRPKTATLRVMRVGEKTPPTKNATYYVDGSYWLLPASSKQPFVEVVGYRLAGTGGWGGSGVVPYGMYIPRHAQ